MNLYIDQKLFSLFGSYNVTNQDGKVLYTVVGAPSLTEKMIVKDQKNNVAGEIKRKLIALEPSWEIYEDGQYIGELHHDHLLFAKDLVVTRLDWHIPRDAAGWDYVIKKGMFDVIGTVSHELFHSKKDYVIHANEDDNALKLLLVSLAVSMYKQYEADKKKKEAAKEAAKVTEEKASQKAAKAADNQ